MELSDYQELACADGDQIRVQIIPDTEHLGTFTDSTTEARIAVEATIARIVDLIR
jgi:hypothetical protein